MPLPLIPLIAAGAGLLNTGINAASTAANNKQTRKHQIAMYKMQRQDNLSDYSMQNDYNSPRAQMARLRESGLNPNLVYGNGAANNAAPVRSAEVQTWNPQAPQFDLSGPVNDGIGAYYDMQIKKATIDNLQAQNTVITDEAALKKAQTLATLSSTGKTNVDTESAAFDLQMKNLTQNYDLQFRQGMVAKQSADTQYTLDENERKQAMQQPNLQAAAEAILRSRAERAQSAAQRLQILAQIKNLNNDTQLKQLDIDLRKMGVQPNDPLWSRVLGRVLNQGTQKAKSLLEKIPYKRSNEGMQK